MKDRTLVAYKNIDRVVDSIRNKGVNAFWDGWTVVIHQPNPRAFTHKRGVFKDGKWGFVRRIRPRSDGRWALPSDLV